MFLMNIGWGWANATKIITSRVLTINFTIIVVIIVILHEMISQLYLHIKHTIILYKSYELWKLFISALRDTA